MAIRTVLTNVTLADDFDVRAVDADDLLDQFESATGERYTANARTYRAGFHRGVALFARRQDQDPAWDSYPPRWLRPRAGPDRIIGHTFPVRAGITTRFALPADLTDGEAQRLIRLIRLIRSLVVQPRPLPRPLPDTSSGG